MTQLSSFVNRMDVADFVAKCCVSRVQASNELLYLTTTLHRYLIEVEIIRQMRTRGISKELLLQIFIKYCVKVPLISTRSRRSLFTPTPHFLFLFTVVTKYVSGRFCNNGFRLSPIETTNDAIELNEGGSILNEHNGVSSMKFISFLDWMETMDQRSQFKFYSEQN